MLSNVNSSEAFSPLRSKDYICLRYLNISYTSKIWSELWSVCEFRSINKPPVALCSHPESFCFNHRRPQPGPYLEDSQCWYRCSPVCLLEECLSLSSSIENTWINTLHGLCVCFAPHSPPFSAVQGSVSSSDLLMKTGICNSTWAGLFVQPELSPFFFFFFWPFHGSSGPLSLLKPLCSRGLRFFK